MPHLLVALARLLMEPKSVLLVSLLPLITLILFKAGEIVDDEVHVHCDNNKLCSEQKPEFLLNQKIDFHSQPLLHLELPTCFFHIPKFESDNISVT